jgi:hypothetical protein
MDENTKRNAKPALQRTGDGNAITTKEPSNEAAGPKNETTLRKEPKKPTLPEARSRAATLPESWRAEEDNPQKFEREKKTKKTNRAKKKVGEGDTARIRTQQVPLVARVVAEGNCEPSAYVAITSS